MIYDFADTRPMGAVDKRPFVYSARGVTPTRAINLSSLFGDRHLVFITRDRSVAPGGVGFHRPSLFEIYEMLIDGGGRLFSFPYVAETRPAHAREMVV